MKELVKKYTKDFNEKFVCYHPIGFVTSKRCPVKAGMQYNKITGKIISIKIKTVGYKIVYFLNKVHPDGDVQLIGTFANREQIKNVNK